jgi:hypothetical protein
MSIPLEHAFLVWRAIVVGDVDCAVQDDVGTFPRE